MPYTIDWYIDQRVLLITVDGSLELEDFHQLHDEAFSYVKASDDIVHAIADLTNFEAIPTNISALFSSSNQEKTQQQGMTVLIMPGLNGVIRFAIGLVLQGLHLEYRIAESKEQAMTILERVDTTLSTVPVE